MEAFFGLRSSNDFTVTGQRPENWREMMLFLYPNGDMPLTALMSKLSNESTDDAHFHWFTKSLPHQTAALLDDGVYTNDTLVAAYASGGAVGDIVYVKVAVADLLQFRVGHQIALRDADKHAVALTGRITAKASTYITVELLEADSATDPAATADYIMIIGNGNAEGAIMPDAISYDPIEHSNLTQIFRTPLDITRTAKKTRLRTGDPYKEAKRECLELHGIEMEKAFLWGQQASVTGTNGKPERYTKGLINTIKEGSGNVTDYKTDTDFSGKTWLQGGEDWLDKWFEQLFRHGSDTRMGFVGSGALLAINKLIKDRGHFEYNEKTYAYGIKAFEWVTPFGTLLMKRHPLFSYEPADRFSMVIFEPTDLKYRYIDDTTFYADGDKQNTGAHHFDGTKEEYLTEAGLEYHFPIKCGYMTNVGSDA